MRAPSVVEVARAMKARRLKLGLSLRELSQKAGVQHSTTLRLERGKDIRLSAYLKLKKALEHES